MLNSSVAQHELYVTQRLLACLIFEIKTYILGELDPPDRFVSTLAGLIDHAPPEVMELVKHLQRNPPEVQEGIYSYSLPFIQWRCSAKGHPQLQDVD